MGFGPVRVIIQVTLHDVVSGAQAAKFVHQLRVAIVDFLMQGVRRNQSKVTRAQLDAFRPIRPKNDSSVAARGVDDLAWTYHQWEITAISSNLYSLIRACVAC